MNRYSLFVIKDCAVLQLLEKHRQFLGQTEHPFPAGAVQGLAGDRLLSIPDDLSTQRA